VHGAGHLDIAAGGGTIDLLDGTSPTQHVDFLGAAGLLELGTPTSFKGIVSEFAAGDQIDLLQTKATGLSFAHDRLSVQGSAGEVASIRFSQPLVGGNFSLAPDGHGGTLIKYN